MTMSAELTASPERAARPRRRWHPALVDYSRMLAVGTAGFGTDFAIFNGLVLAGAAPNLANIAAIIVSAALVFAINLRWTFDHREVALPHHSAARFVLVQIGSLAVVALGVAVLTGLTSSLLVWNIGKFLLTITSGFGRFYLYREWVYSDHGRQPEPRDSQPASAA